MKPLQVKSVIEFVGIDESLLQFKKGNCVCLPHSPYITGPRPSTKCSMAIHSEAELAKETAMQKFVDYLDQLVGAAALATVYRHSSVRSFEESYEPWNNSGQQLL